jgi:hypothetical protein
LAAKAELIKTIIMDNEKESSYHRDFNAIDTSSQMTKLVRGNMDKDISQVNIDKKEEKKDIKDAKE